ncbi:Las1-like-domain-containing protein [Alternaria rosae]|uniref:Las1-like-domain-containing protein n=1 Tax=Alternaria rosae TaxID=1187941 RepID=UPI001E8DDF3C|nr:Las1-like-domain-containing protein [Alternaria rosae]KAH6876026.1 Las1-like-domain-containing protein [Alternaria rosae]
MESHTRFVVTAWRDSRELLQLRQDLYSPETSRREKAVNKVFAWRLRKPDGLPLLLDSTADIVDVVLQDARSELPHNALRLLYATAISRFITGLADTQIDLTRDRPSWFPPGKSLQLPLTLLETRHRIVHRHLPSLAELKRAATESLSWLWEWYWLQLDHAFKTGGSVVPTTEEEEELGVQSREAVREKLQSILKTYVKERKSEIKNRKKDDSKAAETALSTYTLRYAPTATTTPSTQTQRVLLHLLVEEKMILPTDKKLGSTMSGAFIIWTPLLRAFCLGGGVLHIKTLVEHLMRAMNVSSPAARAMMNPEMDPVREGLQDWIIHVLTSEEWARVRGGGAADRKIVEEVLGICFSEPSFWNLKVAEKVLDKGSEVVDQGLWRAVLEAARAEGGEGGKMDVDFDGEVEVEGIERALPVRKNEGKEEKIKGPTKVLGMWKPRPIGWLPEGWEDDD